MGWHNRRCNLNPPEMAPSLQKIDRMFDLFNYLRITSQLITSPRYVGSGLVLGSAVPPPFPRLTCARERATVAVVPITEYRTHMMRSLPFKSHRSRGAQLQRKNYSIQFIESDFPPASLSISPHPTLKPYKGAFFANPISFHAGFHPVMTWCGEHGTCVVGLHTFSQ